MIIFMTFKLKLALGLGLVSSLSFAADLPHSMGSLGDSITAGAVADYTLHSWKKPTEAFSLIKKLMNSNGGRNLDVVERKDLSWSSGLDPKSRVMSHASHIKSLLHARGEDWNFETFNAASSGNTSYDVLNNQLPKLLQWSQKTLNQGAPDYVTLLIGPNDICGKDINEMVETKVFKKQVRTIVDTLIAANPSVKILISEIPDMERVWELAKDYRLSNIRGLQSCLDVWKKMKVCDNILTISDPAQRKQMRARVDEYNVALDELFLKYTKSDPDQVRIARGIFSSKFDLDALSADCFHPNIKGQNMLSDLTWQSSWWK